MKHLASLALGVLVFFNAATQSDVRLSNIPDDQVDAAAAGTRVFTLEKDNGETQTVYVVPLRDVAVTVTAP